MSSLKPHFWPYVSSFLSVMTCRSELSFEMALSAFATLFMKSSICEGTIVVMYMSTTQRIAKRLLGLPSPSQTGTLSKFSRISWWITP